MQRTQSRKTIGNGRNKQFGLHNAVRKALPNSWLTTLEQLIRSRLPANIDEVRR